MKTNRIFKFLSLQLVPREEHQRSSPTSPTHCHVASHLLGPVTHCWGKAAPLNVHEISELKANRAHLWVVSSAGSWIQGVCACVCVHASVFSLKFQMSVNNMRLAGCTGSFILTLQAASSQIYRKHVRLFETVLSIKFNYSVIRANKCKQLQS